MRTICVLFFAIFIIPASANDKGIARINFFPESDSWIMTNYTHTRINIETPRETVMTKEVNNHYNRLSVAYAHRFARKLFAGANLSGEESSENAALYGVPLRRRSSSSGLLDPKIFATYRLRHQKGDRGNIDVHLNFAQSPGPRKISAHTTNRFSGRNTSSIVFGHGHLDGIWEFRNQLGFTYFSAGREENEFLDARFRIENSFLINYAFAAQYEIDPENFLSGSVGITYRSSEITRQKRGEKRELRSGTGSVFQLAYRKKLSEWTLVEGSYALRRSEYFVKARSFNLDGRLSTQVFHLNYIVLF